MTGSTVTAGDEAVVRAACGRVGLDPVRLICLHRHATAVYLLPEFDMVLRVGSRSTLQGAERAVAITRWLAAQDFAAPKPIDVPQPVSIDKWVVTFWRHYSQSARTTPSVTALGRLLRRFHQLRRPPIELLTYTPLVSLKRALSGTSTVPLDDNHWLQAKSAELVARYGELDFALPQGHIHGDAYPGNLLFAGEDVILGDWDEVATGPRELDLVNTYQGARYGRTTEEIDRFSSAYGYDLRDWSGFSTLRELRDMHTLGAFIRRADRGDEVARNELMHRISTLRNDQRHALWSAA